MRSISGAPDASLARRALDAPDRLAALEAKIAVLRAEQLEEIAVLDRALPALAFPDAAREEVAVACKIPLGQAQQRLQAARALVPPRPGPSGEARPPRLPATADALAAGRIGLEHAQRLVDAVGGLDVDSARWVEVCVLGDDRARTPGQFAARASKLALQVGADREERVRRAASRRELEAWEQGGSVSFSWSMPSLDAALVQAWLDGVATREGPDDVRLAAERRGDALFWLVRDAISGRGPRSCADPAESPPASGGRRPPVRLDVIATHESLLDGVWRGAGAGSGDERRDGRWTANPDNRINGRSVFGAQLRKLGCDADLRVTLIDRDGCILDQGLTTRVVSTRLRGLLDLRDQHCRFVGCRVPARRCDAHHVWFWADGGRTDLSNLALLCERHHHAVHDGGWTIHLHPDGSIEWVSPAGQLVRDRAELDTLTLSPPESNGENDHPPGQWIRPSWEFFREPPPTPPDLP